MPSRAAFVRCAPFGLFIGLLVVASFFPAAAPWLAVARGILVALVLAWFWRDYQELRGMPSVPAVHWLVSVVAGVAVFLLWIGIDWDWAVMARHDGFDPHGADGHMNWPLALGRLAGLALVVPVMEELFWRSFLLRWVERHDFLAVSPRQVGWGALIITTALFAVEHNRWFAGAIAGAVYAGLYMRAGNLWVPIVAHAVTNAMLGIWVLVTASWQFW
jgi:CAAX prenyl protease-like protein